MLNELTRDGCHSILHRKYFGSRLSFLQHLDFPPSNHTTADKSPYKSDFQTHPPLLKILCAAKRETPVVFFYYLKG